MRKFFSKYYLTIFASSLFLIIVCFYLFTSLFDNKDVIGIIGAIAAIYFGLLKYNIENDQMFMALFKSFNKKYDGSVNDLFNSLRRNPEHQLTELEKNSIIDYFNLCAEEFLWFDKGRIPKKVWHAWKNGMLSNLQIPQLKKIYDEEILYKESRESYYGLIKELGID